MGIYGAFTTASALRVYPLGTGRPDIFVFPLAILLLALGVHVATILLKRPSYARLAPSLCLAVFAITHPIEVAYRPLDHSNGRNLVECVERMSEPDDAMILERMGILLAAFYGPWSFEVGAADGISNATHVAIDRGRTLHLDGSGGDVGQVADFVSSRPRRIWVIGGWNRHVLVGTLEQLGYALHGIAATHHEELYLAIDMRGSSPGQDAGRRLDRDASRALVAGDSAKDDGTMARR